MATSNFNYDNVLGTIALNTIDFEAEMVCDYNENIAECEDDKITYLDYNRFSYEWDEYYEDWEEAVKDLNDKLDVLKIELESGYYEGAQLKLHYANEYITDLELEQLIDARYDLKQLTKVCRDIDAYYWGVSPSKVFKDYDVLKEWINDNLKCGNLLNLNVAYAFSNGETGYQRTNELL